MAKFHSKKAGYGLEKNISTEQVIGITFGIETRQMKFWRIFYKQQCRILILYKQQFQSEVQQSSVMLVCNR